MDGEYEMMRTPVALGDARFFAHEAMKTTFTLRFVDVEDQDAKGVARECFERVDRLEESLSRFREGGEVWRINHMKAGETLYLSDACHRCLLRAMEAHQATGGLFDITLGRRIRYRKEDEVGPEPSLCGRLIVHPDVPAVTCEEEGRELDLGGIGKGFALDEVVTLMREWGIENTLVTAGASSMRALGDAVWPVDLAGDAGTVPLALANAALSASGTGIQGGHIIHPAEGFVTAAERFRRVWVVAPDATSAEVWSTAIMLVPPDALMDWLGEGGDFERVVVEDQQGMRHVFPSC